MAALSETIKRTSITISNPYQYYVDALVNETLNNEELILYHQINDCFANCFSEAKQKNMPLSKEYKAKGDQLAVNANEKTLTLVSVFSMPFISYYYYKTGNYELAVRESEHIIGTCLTLEQRGQEYLFFCRMQQEQNIGRIAWANHEVEKAITIYSTCMLDIYNKAQQWNLNAVVNTVPVIQLIETTQYLFFIQVFSEMLSQIIAKYVKDKKQAFAHLFLFINPLDGLDFAQLDMLDPRYKLLDSCLKAFICLAAEKEDDFVQQAFAYMDEAGSDDVLKKLMARYIYYFGLM